MSWLSKVSDWLFSSNSGFQESKGGKKLSAERRESLVRSRLEKRQQELANEIEKTFVAYEEKLYDLANTLKSLDDETVKKQAQALEKSQDELKYITKRLESAVKSTHDLERELAEWENRQIETPSQNDYADTVKEIIRSELATRSLQRFTEKSQSQADFRLAEPLRISLPENREIEDPILPMEKIPESFEECLPEVKVEYLLQAIREATHEAERWHVEPGGEVDPEAVLQVRHVKNLHVALKEMDRKNGISRDRLAMAVRIR